MYTFWYDIWYVISSNYALDTEMKNLLSQILVKEYFQFLNRLCDITWFGTVYA